MMPSPAEILASISALNTKIEEAQQRRDLSSAQQLLHIVQQLTTDLKTSCGLHHQEEGGYELPPSSLSSAGGSPLYSSNTDGDLPSPAQQVCQTFLQYGSFVNGVIRLFAEHFYAGLYVGVNHPQEGAIREEVHAMLQHLTGTCRPFYGGGGGANQQHAPIAASVSVCSGSLFAPLRQAELLADISDHSGAQHIVMALLHFQIAQKERKLSDMVVGQKRDRDSQPQTSGGGGGGTGGSSFHTATTTLKSILFAAKVVCYQISMNAAFAMADSKVASDQAQELLAAIAEERLRILSLVSMDNIVHSKGGPEASPFPPPSLSPTQYDAARVLDQRLKKLLVEPLCLLGKINEYHLSQPSQAFHYFHNALVIEPCCASALSSIQEQAILSPAEQEELLLASVVVVEQQSQSTSTPKSQTTRGASPVSTTSSSSQSPLTSFSSQCGNGELYWKLRQLEEESSDRLEQARSSGAYLPAFDVKGGRRQTGLVTPGDVIRNAISKYHASKVSTDNTSVLSPPVGPIVTLVDDYCFSSNNIIVDSKNPPSTESLEMTTAPTATSITQQFRVQCRQSLLLPIWGRLMFTEELLVVLRCYWRLIKSASPLLGQGGSPSSPNTSPSSILHTIKATAFNNGGFGDATSNRSSPTKSAALNNNKSRHSPSSGNTNTTVNKRFSSLAYIVSPSKVLAIISESTAGIPGFVLQLHTAYQLQGHGDVDTFLRATEALFRLSPLGNARASPSSGLRGKGKSSIPPRRTSPHRDSGVDRRSPSPTDTQASPQTILDTFFTTSSPQHCTNNNNNNNASYCVPDVTLSLTHISRSCLCLYVSALVRVKDSRKLYDLGHRLQKVAPYSCVTLYTIGCYYMVMTLYEKAGRCFAQAVDVGSPPSSFSLLPFAAAVTNSTTTTSATTTPSLNVGSQVGGGSTSTCGHLHHQQHITMVSLSGNGGGIAASNLQSIGGTGCSGYSAWGTQSVMPEAWAAFAHCQSEVNEVDSALHTYRRALAACPGIGIGGVLRDILPELRLECDIREKIDQRIKDDLDSSRFDVVKNLLASATSTSQQHHQDPYHSANAMRSTSQELCGRASDGASSSSPQDAASVRWSCATVTLGDASPSPIRAVGSRLRGGAASQGTSSTISQTPESDIGGHPQPVAHESAPERIFMVTDGLPSSSSSSPTFSESKATSSVPRTGSSSDCYSFLGIHLCKLRNHALAALALEDSIRVSLRRNAMYGNLLGRIRYFDRGGVFVSSISSSTSQTPSAADTAALQVEFANIALQQRESELISIANTTFLHQQTSLQNMPLRSVIALLAPLRGPTSGDEGVVAQGDPLVLNELGGIAMDRGQIDLAVVLYCFARQMLQSGGGDGLPSLPPAEECVTEDGKSVTSALVNSFAIPTRPLACLPDLHNSCILFNLAVALRQLPIRDRLNKSSSSNKNSHSDFNLHQAGDASVTYIKEALALLNQYLQCKPDCQHAITAIGYSYHLEGSLQLAISNYHRSLTIRNDAFTEELLKKALSEEYGVVGSGSGGGQHSQFGGYNTFRRQQGITNNNSGLTPKFLTDLRSLASGGFGGAADQVLDVPPPPPPRPASSPTAPSPSIQIGHQFPGTSNRMSRGGHHPDGNNGSIGRWSQQPPPPPHYGGRSSASLHTPQGQVGGQVGGSSSGGYHFRPPPPTVSLFQTASTPPQGPSIPPPVFTSGSSTPPSYDSRLPLDGGGRYPRHRAGGDELAGRHPSELMFSGTDVARPSAGSRGHYSSSGDGGFEGVVGGSESAADYQAYFQQQQLRSTSRGESYSLPRMSGGDQYYYPNNITDSPPQ